MSTSVVSLLAAALISAVAPASAAGHPATGPGDPDPGTASATVLRTSLDVGLLNKTVRVPLNLTLNEVTVPGAGRDSADRTALTAKLDGVHEGRPFSVLRSDVARGTATVDERAASSAVELVKARLRLPGLPAQSVVEVEALKTKAHCPVGGRPTAEADPLGEVTILGQRTRLTAEGPTHVKLPGVGEVRLELARVETTSRTAAASALELSVSVNPLDLGVAEVEGRVTLAEASCRTPRGAGEVTTEQDTADGSAEGAGERGEGARTQTGRAGAGGTATRPTETDAAPDLAETGANSRAPYLAGAALGLLAIGGVLVLARRRRA